MKIKICNFREVEDNEIFRFRGNWWIKDKHYESAVQVHPSFDVVEHFKEFDRLEFDNLTNLIVELDPTVIVGWLKK